LLVTVPQLLLRIIATIAFVLSLSDAAQAEDCLRRLGLGFSAGYHAPVACPTPGCHQKLGVWTGWKQACALPNVRQLGGECGCAPCAPAAPCCGGYSGPSYTLPAGFGLRTLAAPVGCPTCPGGQSGRSPAMFN